MTYAYETRGDLINDGACNIHRGINDRVHANIQKDDGFVARLGIDKLRSILVHDSEGLCARLDSAMQSSVEGYKDPWEEAAHLVHPSQFLSYAATVPE